MVDGYNVDKCLQSFQHLVYYLVSRQARYRWLHIVDGTSGDGNLCRAYSLITEIKLVSVHLNFAVGLDCESILTVKFSG